MPDEVTNGLERTHKPHETGVRATLRTGGREGRRKQGMQTKVKTGRNRNRTEIRTGGGWQDGDSVQLTARGCTGETTETTATGDNLVVTGQ